MLRTFFLLLAGAGLTPASAQGTRPSPLARVDGAWTMPSAIPEGFALATLPPIPAGAEPLQLFATVLPPTGLGCPECIEGRVVGVLDDGVGPGPDFLVAGEYHGFALGDQAMGVFRMAVRHPDGRRAGWIRGRFEDPAGAGPGTFHARIGIGR